VRGRANIPEVKLVSVIMATYNRSNIISYAIRTVLSQTYQRWELIVVGDCCTDDTAAVVASFRDPRISFTNLAENVGEQSGPNNAGLSVAQGDYIAFLNHDDLWFDDHLSNLVFKLESENLDLAYSWWYAPGIPDERNRVMMIDAGLAYNLKVVLPASSWLFRRELIASVGYWRYFKEIHSVPSQDWIRRAHLGGSKIKCVPLISMIAVQSGGRLNSYRDRQYIENANWFEKLRDPSAVRIQMLTDALLEQARLDESVAYHMKSSIWTLLKNIIARLGVQPLAVRHLLTYRVKGGALNKLRRNRGLNNV
jgi:glycosyltransferase involved in cell wall biosynthesis